MLADQTLDLLIRYLVRYFDKRKRARHMFNIENRRYIGNKFKLMSWIKDIMLAECADCQSLFDVFAGTGVVSSSLLDVFESITLNDFLFSNEIIYQGFFGPGRFNKQKLDSLKNHYNNLPFDVLQKDNYFSENFGDKFFSVNDAKKIGYIRQNIEDLYNTKQINKKEYSMLLASLLYSADHIANTVGHYDAFIKGKKDKRSFVFELIEPAAVRGKNVQIFREDSNVLAPKIKADVAFIDPPYNSRQYSRFYHVLETLTKWDKPKLYGVAMKPNEENMSAYCKTSAPQAFADLIKKLNCKYIVVTYNNTYKPKSSSSANKISFEQIIAILNTRGSTKVFNKAYRYFNAGKTEFNDHKEFVFVTKVEK